MCHTNEFLLKSLQALSDALPPPRFDVEHACLKKKRIRPPIATTDSTRLLSRSIGPSGSSPACNILASSGHCRNSDDPRALFLYSIVCCTRAACMAHVLQCLRNAIRRTDECIDDSATRSSPSRSPPSRSWRPYLRSTLWSKMSHQKRRDDPQYRLSFAPEAS